jgi:hypothetical protein
VIANLNLRESVKKQNNKTQGKEEIKNEKMKANSQLMQFDGNFWIERLKDLGYPLQAKELHIGELRKSAIFPSDRFPARAVRLYHDNFLEIVLLEFEELPTRHLCCEIARAWKKKRLIRPMLLFTDGEASCAVIVPGAGVGGECRVLELHEKLHHTDAEVLSLLRYPGSPEKLKEEYDTSFLPYEKVREEFFEGYRSYFEKVVEILGKHLGERARQYAQRFLGRLMFLGPGKALPGADLRGDLGSQTGEADEPEDYC